jgi:hypothetical protein
MSISRVFKTYIEPSLERIPVLEVSHTERHQGREFIITQTIQRNVFTEFDRKLSRHLSATRGEGFPAFTVSVVVNERGANTPGRSLAAAHYVSVPLALKGIAERAYAHSGKADLTVYHNDPTASERAAGVPRAVSADDMEALNAALAICRHLGAAEFLDISGDFDIVIVGPPGDLSPIIMHLQNGSVSVPCGNGQTVTPFECPIHGFAGHASGNVMAQGYLARARQALVAAKEAAVTEFRAEAEKRILGYDRVLAKRAAGRALDGYRLEATLALVARLKAGLGSGLSGLSEEAQVTALDWTMEIAEGAADSATGKHITLAHPAPASA